MAKGKLSQRPSNGAARTSGPNKENMNPRRHRGNPTKGGKIFGNWYKGNRK